MNEYAAMLCACYGKHDYSELAIAICPSCDRRSETRQCARCGKVNDAVTATKHEPHCKRAWWNKLNESRR